MYIAIQLILSVLVIIEAQDCKPLQANWLENLLFWQEISTDELALEEAQAKQLTKEYNEMLETIMAPMYDAKWNFESNINPTTEAEQYEEEDKYYRAYARGSILGKKEYFKHYKQYKDKDLVRELSKYLEPYKPGIDENHFEYKNISIQMQKIYSSASVCLTQNDTKTLKCGLELEPDLRNLMAKSRDFDQLNEVWFKWRDATGKPIRNLYKEYTKFRNQMARFRGFETLEDLWSLGWQTSDFKSQVDELWQEIEPYYQKLHAYVRMKLTRFYGTDKMPKDGTVPAHILGSMTASAWDNIFELVAPFPGAKSLDIGEAMRAQNYTPLRMFQLADKFFTDLGLIPVPEEFWNKSIIEKPADGRKMSCHATSWDFYNKKDFRILMCAQVSTKDFMTIHHEMGHIQYYLQYRNQPVVFRNSPNIGLHEAIGDIIALSVTTPAHLAKIHLIKNYVEDEELTLNYLMKMALFKIPMLPFAYSTDAWRWDLVLGEDDKVPEEMNRHWWWYRLHMQGISPPVKRNESDLDAGATFHVAHRYECIRYFVSIIVQFQFHKSLCDIAQPSVPLHQCDIDGNREAGDRLSQMMALGSTREWTYAMKLMTGREEMSAKSMIEYFEPLFKWIDKQIEGETVGWTVDVQSYMENTVKSTQTIETSSSQFLQSNGIGLFCLWIIKKIYM